MRRIAILVGSSLILAAIACNAPSRSADQPTPDEFRYPTETAEEPGATSAEASQAANEATETIELPDIQGTVGAQSNATVDPKTPAILKGRIAYPNGTHPSLRVYVLSTDGQTFQYVQLLPSANNYSIEVPAGEYFIMVDASPGDGAFEGAYSTFSACAKDGEDTSGCEALGHDLIAILAQPGQVLENIDIWDWQVQPVIGWPGVPG
jgi:hypothetical protein